jgi:hypothetical protein
MSEQRLPTAGETIISGLVGFMKKTIAEDEKIQDTESDLCRKFYSGRQQLLTQFCNNVKEHVTKTGNMPQEVSADSDVKVNLFNYHTNKRQDEIYDIYEDQSMKECAKIKSILAERGFKIKSIGPLGQGWMRDVEDWDGRDTKYMHGCHFVLGSHKEYFPDI